MKVKRAYTNIHLRINPSESKQALSQEEIKHRLTAFFLLLLEIGQQNNVTKEYHAKQAE